MNQSFTYRGEITGSINKKGKVISFFKGHNRGEIGLQKLFALALLYKINEIPKFIPKAIEVTSIGGSKVNSITPIPISGLRLVEDKESYPKYSIEFEVAIPYEALNAQGTIYAQNLEITLINSNSEEKELASFNLKDCFSEKEAKKELTPGLQIGITWKMYLDIGDVERSES